MAMLMRMPMMPTIIAMAVMADALMGGRWVTDAAAGAEMVGCNDVENKK